MVRRSAAEALRTAQELLEVAATLFAERGYADTSVDQVAVAAGVTRGAVYHHFGNKQGLFLAVAAQLQAAVAEQVVRAAGEAGDDAGAGLRAGSRAFLDAITTPQASMILLVDAPAVLGWAQWRRLDEENSVGHLRQALLEAGVDRELLPAAVAQLSGAMNEAALWIAEHSDPSSARRQAQQVLDRLLDAVIG